MKIKTHVRAGGAGYACTTDSDCPQGGKCEQTCIQTGMCAFS